MTFWEQSEHLKSAVHIPYHMSFKMELIHFKTHMVSPISEQSGEAIIATGITSAMLLLVVIVIHHRLTKIRLCVMSWRSVFANNKKATPSLITSISNRSSSFEFHERSLGSF